VEKQSTKSKSSGIISQCLGLAIVVSGILIELFLRTEIGFATIYCRLHSLGYRHLDQEKIVVILPYFDPDARNWLWARNNSRNITFIQKSCFYLGYGRLDLSKWLHEAQAKRFFLSINIKIGSGGSVT